MKTEIERFFSRMYPEDTTSYHPLTILNRLRQEGRLEWQVEPHREVIGFARFGGDEAHVLVSLTQHEGERLVLRVDCFIEGHDMMALFEEEVIRTQAEKIGWSPAWLEEARVQGFQF